MADITALGFVVASTIVSSFGLLLFKLASATDMKKMFFTKHFILGGLLFLASGVLIILALRTEELSTIFPITALTYLWVMMLSMKFLKEVINKWKITSVLLIIIGILLVTAA